MRVALLVHLRAPLARAIRGDMRFVGRPIGPLARGEYPVNVGLHRRECDRPMLPTGPNNRTRRGTGGMAFRGPWGVPVAPDLAPPANQPAGWEAEGWEPEGWEPGGWEPGGWEPGGWTGTRIIHAVTQGISANDRPLVPQP